jgi:hypothetical protein
MNLNKAINGLGLRNITWLDQYTQTKTQDKTRICGCSGGDGDGRRCSFPRPTHAPSLQYPLAEGTIIESSHASLIALGNLNFSLQFFVTAFYSFSHHRLQGFSKLQSQSDSEARSLTVSFILKFLTCFHQGIRHNLTASSTSSDSSVHANRYRPDFSIAGVISPSGFLSHLPRPCSVRREYPGPPEA